MTDEREPLTDEELDQIDREAARVAEELSAHDDIQSWVSLDPREAHSLVAEVRRLRAELAGLRDAASAVAILNLERDGEIHRLRAEKAALLNCAHATHTPVTSVDWCPKCGAVAVEGQWQKTVS